MENIGAEALQEEPQPVVPPLRWWGWVAIVFFDALVVVAYGVIASWAPLHGLLHVLLIVVVGLGVGTAYALLISYALAERSSRYQAKRAIEIMENSPENGGPRVGD